LAAAKTTAPAHDGAPTGPVMQTLSLDDADGPLVFDVWEPGQAAAQLPVLLVHGWGASGGYWRLAAERLAETSRVIVPDLPGTGRSQPVRRPQGMFEQATALTRILDALGIDRVQVVGHSMGGAMGLLLADAAGERVERLVLTSLCLFASRAEKRTFRILSKGFRIWLRLRKTPLAALPLFSKAMTSRYFYRMPRELDLVDGLYRDFLELDEASAIACAAGATDAAIDRAATRIRVPTLIIVCRQDGLMPVGNVDYTARQIPGSCVRWMDGSGHLPMLERPDEYVRLLRGFLQGPRRV